ncbi:MAG: hypothetical protein GXP16_16405 [Gammaproteobacteria bacterium]|nr:hypothetical protein [Gammaproteobacteria bacterium]
MSSVPKISKVRATLAALLVVFWCVFGALTMLVARGLRLGIDVFVLGSVVRGSFVAAAVDGNFNNTPGLPINLDVPAIPLKYLKQYFGPGAQSYLDYS